MIVYVGAGSGPFRDMIVEAGHGQMVSRQYGPGRVPARGRWAFDNGAYTDWKRGEPFDNEEFLAFLRAVEALPGERLPDWAVVPDLVGDAWSLAHSLRWRDLLRSYAPRLDWYLAVQDGFRPDDVAHALCLEPFDGLFVGGTTRWKLDTAPAWVGFGHARGLPVHVGRINGPARLRWAIQIGADSVDGTGWVKAGARWIEHLRTLPGPVRGLFPPPGEEFPEEWLGFGAWLREAWSEEDWRARLASDDACWEFAQSVWSLPPEEFAAWFSRVYFPLALPAGGFPTKEEYKEWAWDNLAEAERLMGPRPPPPLPEPAKWFVAAAGVPRPLSEAPPGRERLCETTGRPVWDALGPGGVVLATYPILLAADAEEARRYAEGRLPGCPPGIVGPGRRPEMEGARA